MAVTVVRCRDSGEDSCGTSTGTFTVVYRVCSDDKNELDPATILASGISEWRPQTFYGTGDLFTIEVPSTGGPWLDNDTDPVTPGLYVAHYVAAQTSGTTFDEAELAKMLTTGAGGALPGCYDRYKALDGTRYLYTVRKRSVSELKKGENGYCRDVTVTYEEIELQNGVNATIAILTTDPLLWCPEIKIDTAEITEGEHQFPFLGFYEDLALGQAGPCPDPPLDPADLKDVVNSCVSMTKGEIEPLQTTAGQPFEPVEKTSIIRNYAFTFNRVGWEAASVFKCYENTINSAEFTLAILCNRGFSFTFEPYTAWLQAVVEEEAELTVDDGDYSRQLRFVRTTYLISWNPKGWYLDIANKGVKRCMFDNAANPDGFGGSYGYTSPTQPPDAQPLDVGIKDVDGVLVNAPIWLDKRGFPERQGNRAYLRYVDGFLSDFNDVALKLVNWLTV